MRRFAFVGALLLSLTLMSFAAPPQASASTEPHLAEITLFAGNFAPRGWKFCEGQLLPIPENQALFSLLGTMYGGDGRATFGLPDLRPAEVALRKKGAQRGPRYIIATAGVFPSRH